MFKSDIMVHRFLGYFDTVNHQPVINETNQPSRHSRPSRPPSSIARLYFAGHLIVEEVALLTPSFSALKSLDVYNVYIYTCIYIFYFVKHYTLTVVYSDCRIRFSFCQGARKTADPFLTTATLSYVFTSSAISKRDSSKRSILPQVWSFDRFLPLYFLLKLLDTHKKKRSIEARASVTFSWRLWQKIMFGVCRLDNAFHDLRFWYTFDGLLTGNGHVKVRQASQLPNGPIHKPTIPVLFRQPPWFLCNVSFWETMGDFMGLSGPRRRWVTLFFSTKHGGKILKRRWILHQNHPSIS